MKICGECQHFLDETPWALNRQGHCRVKLPPMFERILDNESTVCYASDSCDLHTPLPKEG